MFDIFVFVTELLVNVVATAVIIYLEHLYALIYKELFLNPKKEALLILVLLMFLVLIAYFDPNLVR